MPQATELLTPNSSSVACTLTNWSQNDLRLCLSLRSVASTTCEQIERLPSTPRRVSYLECRAWTSPSVVRFYFRNFSRSVGPKKQSTSLPSFASPSLLWGSALRPHLTFRYPSPNTPPFPLCWETPCCPAHSWETASRGQASADGTLPCSESMPLHTKLQPLSGTSTQLNCSVPKSLDHLSLISVNPSWRFRNGRSVPASSKVQWHPTHICFVFVFQNRVFSLAVLELALSTKPASASECCD